MSANLKTLLLQAAERIESNNECLWSCHTSRGVWQLTTAEDVEAYREFHEDQALANALRAEDVEAYREFHEDQALANALRAEAIRLHDGADLPAMLRRQAI